MLERLNSTLDSIINATSYFRSSDEKTNAINPAQWDYFKEIAGDPVFHGRGAAVPPISFQQTSVLNSKLSKFYKPFAIAQNGTTILSEKIWEIVNADPTVIIYDPKVLSRKTATTPSDIQVLPGNQYHGRLKDPLCIPSTSDPVATYYTDFQYLMAPDPIAAETMAMCLVLPKPCRIVITDGVYDVGASTDLEWDESAFDAILARTLVYLGINIANPMVTGMGNQLTREIV